MKFTVLGARPATSADLEAAETLRRVKDDQLIAVRAMAENWRNGVGLVTTALGSALFIASPEVLEKSTHVNVVNGGWLLGLALICLTISIGCALRASSGWPQWLKVDTLQALQTWKDSELQLAVKLVHVSMGVSVAALALLGTASAVLLFQVPLFFNFPSWY